MALTINIPDLGEVRADTAAELASLVKLLRKDAAERQPAAPPAQQPVRQVHSPQSVTAALMADVNQELPGFTRYDRSLLTLRFLKAIAEAGPRGVDSQSMQSILGIDPSRPKGISGKTGPINTYLKDLGFNLDAVYTTTRTTLGRVWYQGKQIADAIGKVDEDANSI